MPSDSTPNGTPATKPSGKVLTKSSINPAVVNAEYAVRGEIALKAEDYRSKLRQDPNKYGKELGFDKVVNCNIGNPQQLEQRPITFVRQVAALTEYPALLDHPGTKDLFPKDAIDRAKWLLEEIGSIGAYSHSQGVPAIRNKVAEFIERRDGHPASPNSIFLTAGASAGVSSLLQTLVASPSTGVLIPIPQYPLYTAALALNSARAVPYLLSESSAWGTNVSELSSLIQKARSEGTDVRAIVVINPGNPTGSCLSRENVEEVIRFAHEEKVVIMADEVYQTNIYTPKERPFISFKKVLRELGAPYTDSVELVSFHSISKGQMGECGRRGGYFEVVNFDEEVVAEIYKMASINLCPPLSGQIGVDVLVDPPKEGQESWKEWKDEVEDIQGTLKERSELLVKAFRELEGVECVDAQGALYLFPRITLPSKAVEAAKKASKAPDAFYCVQLLEKTGICVVPGSGFGQEDGTFHYRTTFLAPGTDEYVSRLKGFHEGFMDEYRD